MDSGFFPKEAAKVMALHMFAIFNDISKTPIETSDVNVFALCSFKQRKHLTKTKLSLLRPALKHRPFTFLSFGIRALSWDGVP